MAPLDGPHKGAPLDVPHREEAICGGCTYFLGIWAECDSQYVAAVLESFYAFIFVNVPQFTGSIP
jgi:hypothetical protein